MKVRIAWRGVAGYVLVLVGSAIGILLAPWPYNGVTLLALLMVTVGAFLVGTVVTR